MTTTFSNDQKLKAKALNSLARREHSRFELKQKLSRVSTDETNIEKILDELETKQWLSDLRFAQAFLSARAQRYYGPRKIRYELKERGVSVTVITRAFAECTINWQELAEQARQKKFGQQTEDTWPARAKQMEYLYQRGFEAF